MEGAAAESAPEMIRNCSQPPSRDGACADLPTTPQEELKFKKVMGFSTYLSPGKSNA